MLWLKLFAAGFVSTLVFHQGVLGALYAAGVSPRAPYSMAATAPLGVPQVISLALWGGLWALALGVLLRTASGPWYWWSWVIAGAIGPSIVALFVVLPLKGMPVAGGWDPKLIAAALLLNGAWGLGVALLMKLMPHG